MSDTNTRPTVVVFDYGFGNVHSAVKALTEAGADVTLSADPETAVAADGLLVPGVGSFAAVMRGLTEAQGPQIIGRRLAGGRPVMGICVGMQIMFERGLEGDELTECVTEVAVAPEERVAMAAAGDAEQATVAERIHAKGADDFWWAKEEVTLEPGVPGLGEWPGVVRKLKSERLPHMGWNTVEPPADSMLFRGIEGERYYFVHSYCVEDVQLEATIPGAPPISCTYSTYGERFVAAVENGPLCATQFHPEKSGEAGIALLRNWVATL